MLKFARDVKDIRIIDLMAVYSLRDSYSEMQIFYLDLLSFFEEPLAIYALWVVDDCYCAALRLEPYKDGFLVAGLETHPDKRNKGYATMLLNAVAEYTNSKLYSHVDRNNRISLRVHEKCGFQTALDYAVYLDGGISRKAITMCKIKRADT